MALLEILGANPLWARVPVSGVSGGFLGTSARGGAQQVGGRIGLVAHPQAPLGIGLTREQERLQRALPLLATTASVTPFIGLFGTVWGIMNTFHAIGATGSSAGASVAPPPAAINSSTRDTRACYSNGLVR